jgi:5-methylcytosine-specific restriction protein A
MTTIQDTFCFQVTASPSEIRKEKEKAKALRKTQWWQRQLGKGRCHYCGRSVAPQLLTMDHVVPLARGGRSTRGNLVPCCKECNNNKKYLLPIEWQSYMARLQADADRDRTPQSGSEG